MRNLSAMARSASAAGARGLSSTTGTPRLTACGMAMSDGMRYSAVDTECSFDVADVEVHLGVRTVQHEVELVAGQRQEVERLDADLQVLDARDVHARDEQYRVGLYEQRQRRRRRSAAACR